MGLAERLLAINIGLCLDSAIAVAEVHAASGLPIFGLF